MIRRHAAMWGALLAFSSGLFALQCSLEGLGDGVRPSGPDGGDGAVGHLDAGDAANAPRPDNAIMIGLPAPDQLAIAPDFLYFTTNRAGGAVERCPIRGCQAEPESIALGQTNPRGLTVTQTGIVGWVNFGSGQVMLASRSAGSSIWNSRPHAVGQASPAGMAIWAHDDAVWTNLTAETGTAMVARGTGQPANIVALSRKADHPGPILLPGDGKDVVWGDNTGLAETLLDGDGADGNAPCTFVRSHAPVTNIVSRWSDPLELYWSTADGALLMARRPRAADALQHCVESTITSLVKEQGEIASLAIDALYLYFSVSVGGKGSLRRVSTSGGEAEVLLDDLNDPRGVVIDQSYVYVAVRGDGTIRRLAREGT